MPLPMTDGVGSIEKRSTYRTSTSITFRSPTWTLRWGSLPSSRSPSIQPSPTSPRPWMSTSHETLSMLMKRERFAGCQRQGDLRYVLAHRRVDRDLRGSSPMRPKATWNSSPGSSSATRTVGSLTAEPQLLVADLARQPGGDRGLEVAACRLAVTPRVVGDRPQPDVAPQPQPQDLLDLDHGHLPVLTRPPQTWQARSELLERHLNAAS